MSSASTSVILFWAEALYQRLRGFDRDGGPDQPGPVVIDARMRLAVADLLRKIAGNIRDVKAAAAVRKQSLSLAERASAELIRGWPDDLDRPHPGLPEGPIDPHPYYPPKKLEWRQSVFESVTPALLDQLLAGVAQRLVDVAGAPAAAPKVGGRGG